LAEGQEEAVWLSGTTWNEGEFKNLAIFKQAPNMQGND
jgi:hypothetical protein